MAENESTATGNDLASGQYKGRDVIQKTIQRLTQGLERECVIMSPVLDPHFFNNSVFVEALTTFVTHHPRNIAKILVENSSQVISENGRLITLCRRLSENLSLRSVPEEYQGQSDMFFVGDNQNLLVQPNVSYPDIKLNVTDRTVAAPFIRRFDYAWQRSEAMPGLHTLGL